MIINQGPVVEMKTRRPYFLDYPCDLKPGEKVTFVLSLHGGGSYGNWQRHYFPIWTEGQVPAGDRDAELADPRVERCRRSVSAEHREFVVEQIGKDNIKAFWLVGHSQGGMTSNRIVRTDFFKARSTAG